MAPKRACPSADVGGVVQVLESASSNLRHVANKRLRLSSVESDNQSTSTSEILSNVPSTQFARHVDFRAEYERDRDEVSEKDSDDDDQEVEAETQRIREERVNNGMGQINQPLEAGVLESVVCVNFMCHEKLTVTFGPLINFIIGHNGSGKSAVLTAITLCLGGKATSTNRGQNLKSFIKAGKDHSSLTVRIKNRGETAFKRDLYRETIVVERHFSLQGTSSFKIKSADGRIISTKRAELNEITDFYALQLDNPVNVLTQDMARHFLNSSSTSEKYKFLVKGVLLEQLDNDYGLVADSLNQADAQLEGAQEDCKVLREKYDAAQKKLDLSNQQNTLRDKIRMYGRQMAWAQVEEQEQNLEEQGRILQQAQQKIELRQQAADSASASYDSANKEHKDGVREKEEMEIQLNELKEAEEEVESRVKDKNEELSNAKSEERNIHFRIQSHETTRNGIQSKIDEERLRLRNLSGEAEAAKQRDIEQAQEKLQEIDARIERNERALPDLLQNKKDTENDFKQADSHLKSKREELQTASDELRGLEHNRGSRLAGFEQATARIRGDIERDSRYREKPVGPMGLHVRLLQPKWSSIIEKSFGSSLDAYVVTSRQDQTILAETLRKHRSKASIFVGSKTPLDTRPHEPEHYLCILRALETDNDLVRNQLVINHSIDKTVLEERHEEARRIMFDESPRNVQGVMYINQSKPGWGGRYSFGRGKAQKDDFVDPWRGSGRMATDDGAQIENQKRVVEVAREKVSDAEQDRSTCMSHQSASSQAAIRHGKQLKSLRETDRPAADEEVQRLRDELEEMQPTDGKVDSLESDLKDEQEKLEWEEAQLEECEKHKEEIGAALWPMKQDLKEKVKAHKNCEGRVKETGKRLEQLEDMRTATLRGKNEAIAQVQDAERERDGEQVELRSRQQDVEEFTAHASNICARVPVDRGESTESLDRLLVRLNRDLERSHRELGGDNEQIHRQALEAKESHVNAEKQFKSLVSLQESLISSLANRRRRWKAFRSAISQRARSNFVYLLSERGFRGRMLIDHMAKALDLQVEPDLTKRERSRSELGRKTNTLSGGEKSFTTVCMLLAMWDAMGSPIRCLDEFDVFMDSVNRDMSVRTLIESARRSVGRQFILITPQAMGSIDHGPDVRVIRLSDPERGQKTLNLPGA